MQAVMVNYHQQTWTKRCQECVRSMVGERVGEGPAGTLLDTIISEKSPRHVEWGRLHESTEHFLVLSKGKRAPGEFLGATENLYSEVMTRCRTVPSPTLTTRTREAGAPLC